jgi:glycosyltransferase involved in cell wall biosynthesis
MGKKLIYFGTGKLEDMIHKGNVWYVRHYEAYFDEVYVVYLTGDGEKTLSQGNTYLVSLGSGGNKLDLFFAPYRLWKYSRKVRPTSYLTADLVFSWWTSILIRIFLRAKIILMPVCMPHVIYESSGRSLSGLPFWLEKLFLKFSFQASARVLTSHAFGNFVEWLSIKSEAKNKLKVVDTIVDALPTHDFLQKASQINVNRSEASSFFTLLYVGRLHSEKLVDQLIEMVKYVLTDPDIRLLKPIQLIIIGDGRERKKLEGLAEELGVRENIKFIGYIPNEQIASYYYNSDVFVSPLTGSSLREAALFGLPIVAYEMDWVVEMFQHNENILFAKPGNPQDMAGQVIRLLKEPELAIRIGQKAKELAWKKWGNVNMKEELARSFEEWAG